MSIFFPRDEYFMRLALREAERALEHDDVPVGCVIARDQELIGGDPTERELRGDPTAHAEILALPRGVGGDRKLAPYRCCGVRHPRAVRHVCGCTGPRACPPRGVRSN